MSQAKTATLVPACFDRRVSIVLSNFTKRVGRKAISPCRVVSGFIASEESSLGGGLWLVEGASSSDCSRLWSVSTSESCEVSDVGEDCSFSESIIVELLDTSAVGNAGVDAPGCGVPRPLLGVFPFGWERAF